MTGLAPVVVRPAGAADVDFVIALEAEAFPLDPWSPVLIAEAIAGIVPTISVLVAEVAGEPIGYALTSTVQDIAELQRVATVAAARRTGVASALLVAVADAAEEAGAERLLLEVREDNAAALAFYAVHGFAEIARRPRYYRDGTTAVVLERSLVTGRGAGE